MTSHEPNQRPPLLRGAAFWALFALVAVLLRGVRWDENYEFAQAMDAGFGYPESHPLVLYVRNVYNAQIHISALAASFTDSQALLNGFRNVAFILATVLPPFLLGSVAAGRAIAGHVCVLFVLAGIHLEFDGSYPQFIWPGMFSNGHIGTGFALAAVALFAGGYLRTAAFMVGIMPMVHLGQLPPLLLFAIVMGARAVSQGRVDEVSRAVPYLIGGVALCIVMWLIQRAFAVPLPTTGAEAGEVWQLLVLHSDMHRRIPVENSHLVPLLIAPLALAGRFLLQDRRPAWNRLCVYAACVIVIVYVTISIHLLFGADTPYVLIGWLPYRLGNHLPVIAIALAVAAILNRNTAASWLVAALLLFLAIRPAFPLFMNEMLFKRYLSTTDAIFFGLTGAATAWLLANQGDWRCKTGCAVAFLGVWLVVLDMHQFGATCVVAGAGLGGISGFFFRAPSSLPNAFRYATTGLAAALLTTTLFVELANRAHLPVGDFERDVVQYLDDHGAAKAMLVGPPYQLMLQAQTGHPVMADMATRYHGSYVPALAPTVHRLYLDVYGIDLTQPEHAQADWQNAWATRSSEEWTAVGRAYSFEYVIAPNTLTLDLERVVEGGDRSLFKLPRSSAVPVSPSPPAPDDSDVSDAQPTGQTTGQD